MYLVYLLDTGLSVCVSSAVTSAPQCFPLSTFPWTLCSRDRNWNEREMSFEYLCSDRTICPDNQKTFLQRRKETLARLRLLWSPFFFVCYLALNFFAPMQNTKEKKQKSLVIIFLCFSHPQTVSLQQCCTHCSKSRTNSPELKANNA